MQKFIFFLLLFPAYLFAQTCQYLAYDGFNYANNVPLHNQFGGVGWAERWEVQNSNADIPGYTGANTSPMSYSNLLGFGNYIVGGNNYLTIGRRLNLANGGPFTPFLNGAGRIGQAGTTLYMSVLLRKEYNNDQIVAAMLQGGNNTPWVTNQNPRAVVGYFGTASEIAGVKYWSLSVNNSVFVSNVPITIGATTLLVMRIDFGNGTHTVSFWANPATIAATMPSPNLTQTITGTLQFNAFAASLGYANGQASMDEIRIGSSYECVTPDNTTAINVPPDASFTTNVSGGTSPLSINFDASASSDPDGSIVSYHWVFGDGAQQTTLTPIVSHTYSILGNINPTLTVTDTGGLQHTAYGNILITNANGNFPCQTAIQAISRVSCGQSNGSFSVNAGGASFQLYNASNALIPISATPNVYNNLSTGTYMLYVNSVQGCRDTLTLHIETDSSTCAGWTPPTCLKMGMNLDYVNYYDRQRMFKNFRLDAGDWITYNVTSPTPWTVWNTGVYGEIPMDTNGYPTQIPFTTSIGPQGVRLIFSADGHLPLGNYTFWYDGDGTIVLNGVTVTQQQAGRIDFTVNSLNTNIWADFVTSTLGNHIRNIRILRPGDELTYQSQPFYQGFLDKIAPFHTLRFVEATVANSNNFTPTHWVERATPDYYTNGGFRGMSYEMIIRLANTAQKNVWINIPHTASDDYMQQMARLFRDSLNPNLEVYLEYSNEVWNWQFTQAHFVSENGAQNISYPRRYAERSRNAFRIWSQEFNGQMHRLHRVLNTQMGNAWYAEQILAQMKPNEYDYLSPTWYFGYTGSPCAQSFNASTSPADVIACTRQNFHANYPNMRQDYLTASLFGKKVVNYEGGHHMTDAGATTPYTQAVYSAQLHPDMYNLYIEVLDSVKKLGPVMCNAYNLARRLDNIYGSFGHLTDVDLIPTMANAPKWMALMQNVCPINSTPLAIEWAHFQVTPYRNEAAVLNWSSYSEIDNWGFELERSTDNQHFEKIGWVKGKNEPNAYYRWKDATLTPNVLYYYRIKQIDMNGHFSYSETQTCILSGEEHFLILSPNPNTGNFSLVMDRPSFLQIFDLQGQLLYEEKQEKTRFELALPQLPAGMYIVKTTNGAVKWWKM